MIPKKKFKFEKKEGDLSIYIQNVRRNFTSTSNYSFEKIKYIILTYSSYFKYFDDQINF